MGDIISDLREVARWIDELSPTHAGEVIRAADELQHWRSAAESCGAVDGFGWAMSYDELERQRDEAVTWIGGFSLELVEAGGRSGDRAVALENLKAFIAERDALKAEVERLKAERDEALTDNDRRLGKLQRWAEFNGQLCGEVEKLKAEHIADQATIDKADAHTKMLMAEIERLSAAVAAWESKAIQIGLPTDPEAATTLANQWHAEMVRLKAELGPLREVIGVRADAVSHAVDRDYWCKLIDRHDDAVRAEAEVERLRVEAAEAEAIFATRVPMGMENFTKGTLAEKVQLLFKIRDDVGRMASQWADQLLPDDKSTIERLNTEVERLKADAERAASILEQQSAVLASVADLSHPNCQMLLRDVERLKSQLAELRGDVCENGHTDHAECDERCACYGSGRSRLERAEAEVERMVNVAGDALETDPSLRSTACVDALAAYVQTVRADLVKAQREAFRRGAVYQLPLREFTELAMNAVDAEANRRYPEVK